MAQWGSLAMPTFVIRPWRHLGPNPRRFAICSLSNMGCACSCLLGVAMGVQWEVDRSMRRLWTTDTICKGKRKARTSDWPDWYSDDDGGTSRISRIPGSFVHTVIQEATCSSNATEAWTSDEIEVRIMLGQDPTNEDIGESASLEIFLR
jgi:hypothetical protein